MAQWIRRETTNLEIAGSNPAGDVFVLLSFNWFCSVMAITLDFESNNPGSNPGRTSLTHRSSAGRAEDCNVLVMVILRSLVRSRPVRFAA